MVDAGVDNDNYWACIGGNVVLTSTHWREKKAYGYQRSEVLSQWGMLEVEGHQRQSLRLEGARKFRGK
jgi:hypothetical protein